MPFLAEPVFTHGTPARSAILLVNLGTPEAPTTAAVRRYLKEFLSDPRVVEIARPLWWLILNGIILNLRPAKAAAKYAKIWDQDGSPLKLHTERQAKLLRAQIAAQELCLALGMQFERRAVLVPDLRVFRRRFGRTQVEDDAVQDQPPQRPRDFYHARIGQEFLQVAAHRRSRRRLRRTQVDEQDRAARRRAVRKDWFGQERHGQSPQGD